MAFGARAAILAAVMGIVPVAAVAQPAGPSGAPTEPAPTGTAPAETAPAGSAAGSASAAPVVPATGYGWSTTPRKRGTRPRHWPVHPGSQGPDAILPGFETLGDGSTRLFVILTKPVQYQVKAARGTITYVLKGAHVDKRNNYNPLVTVHFNTPVTNARLMPHDRDLWFVVDLRAEVTPAVTMDATKDGGAMLRIDFPKGDYLPGQARPPVTPAPPAPPQGPAQAPPPASR
jgi:hypothetical protein